MSNMWKAMFQRNQYLDDLRRAEGFADGYAVASDEILGKIARRMHHKGFPEAEIVKALDLPLDTIHSYFPCSDNPAS